MSTAASLITFDEFLQMPEAEGEKLELVEGEVVSMPPPVTEHSKIAQRILRLLTEKIGWSAVFPDATGYRIGESCLVPDVSVQYENQAQDERTFIGAPLIAIEILSPHEETESKISIYLRGGAREVWMVNPKLKMLVVYTGEARIEVTDKYRSEAISQTVTLSDIFG
jgi:Uma2 family endonuclease